MKHHHLLKSTIRSFHVHDVHQASCINIRQPISNQKYETRRRLGIQDVRDYSLGVDHFCTSIDELFLQLMIDDLARRAPSEIDHIKK